MPPRTSTILYTPTAPGWTSVHSRTLPPILPHPSLHSVKTPTLPGPPRLPVFRTTPHGVYRLSTHLVPAAYPRLTPDVPVPVKPPFVPGGSPDDRRNGLDALLKQILATQAAYEGGNFGGVPSKKLFWNCLNRYVRTPVIAQRTGVTLFLAHATSFPKETWETMLQALLDAPAGKLIDEVWAWEATQHGDSAIINAGNLNGIYDWLDNTRDIANFLIHYLPEEVEATALPTQLQRLPSAVARLREERGYHTRKLVVVGHSFGACTSLRVAIDFPKLFSSFVLIDPVIHRPPTFPPHFVPGALTRRDHWPSREEALQLLQKSPFFGAWHPDVFKLYIEFAITDDADGGVRLKLPGIHEALVYTNERLPYEMWELLETLEERIALRWVVPSQPLTTNELTHERVWRRPANTTNIMFHFAGHLIPQEAPLELAHDISDFLLGKHGARKSCL